MPYDHIEEIQSRKGEKIAMFLTIENAMGLILGAFPAYLLSANWPFLLRILLVGAAAGLGVAATLDVGGLTFYERVAWRVRGTLRQRLTSEPITPEQISGAASTVRPDRPLARHGPIQLRPVAAPVMARPSTRSADALPLHDSSSHGVEPDGHL